jgi:3-deoxy-manno-octulosonate cytidylyltransferase (CMP-KDO synthetase)
MESTRFPGKPLAPLAGMPMVMHCAKNATEAGFDTYICSDSEVIEKSASLYGYDVIRTPDFKTGTDRVKWACDRLHNEIIVNLQGDEPLITPKALKEFGFAAVEILKDKDCILNGLAVLHNSKAFDVNNVKAVTSSSGRILYLSRKAIKSTSSKDAQDRYTKQLGLYAFSREALGRFSQIQQSGLEKAENIEMLRWIEADLTLIGIRLDTPSVSVDTPEDLAEAEILYSQKI